MTMILIGCGKPITMETALKNSAEIKSFSYLVDLNMKVSNFGPETDGALQLNMNGKASADADRMKTQADISATMDGESVKFPIYVDTAAKKFDFEIFAGIPDLIKDSFAGKTDFYASSEQLDMLLKLALTEDQYKTFQNELKTYESGQTSPLATALQTYIQSYMDKNSEKIQKFESTKGESVSKNGTYSYTFTKDDIKTMAIEFLSNKDNYQLIKDQYSASAALSGQDTSADMPDAETMITEINKAIDTLKTLGLTVKFTIEDGYISGIGADLSGVSESDGQINLTFSIKLSDINKSVAITMPDKNADTTLDIIDYFKSMFSGQQDITDPNASLS